MNKYINTTTNDSFTNLKGLDIQELLLEIDNYLLEYRELINIPNHVTFGTEIEYENVSKKKLTILLNQNYMVGIQNVMVL